MFKGLSSFIDDPIMDTLYISWSFRKQYKCRFNRNIHFVLFPAIISDSKFKISHIPYPKFPNSTIEKLDTQKENCERKCSLKSCPVSLISSSRDFPSAEFSFCAFNWGSAPAELTKWGRHTATRLYLLYSAMQKYSRVWF